MKLSWVWVEEICDCFSVYGPDDVGGICIRKFKAIILNDWFKCIAWKEINEEIS